MTGFDETVPPDIDPSKDATSADNATENVVPPASGPTQIDRLMRSRCSRSTGTTISLPVTTGAEPHELLRKIMSIGLDDGEAVRRDSPATRARTRRKNPGGGQHGPTADLGGD